MKTRTSQKPLLLIVGDTRTHAPWHEHDTYAGVTLTIPKRWIDTPDTRRLWENYLGEVTAVDTTVGNIDRIAQDYFNSDDFLFVYTLDHGHAWPFGKWNLYDWGTQVAFQARWPGKIAANTRTDAMISWIDIFPTFLELAGKSLPGNIDGKSFAKVLTGETETHRRPAVEFYDIVKEPEETKNLASNPEYADESGKMAKQLDDWMQENRDTVRMEHESYPLSEPYPGPKAIDKNGKAVGRQNRKSAD